MRARAERVHRRLPGRLLHNHWLAAQPSDQLMLRPRSRLAHPSAHGPQSDGIKCIQLLSGQDKLHLRLFGDDGGW